MTMNADRVNAMDALAREIQASMRGQIDRAGALAISRAKLEVLRDRAVVSALFAEMLNGFAKIATRQGRKARKSKLRGGRGQLRSRALRPIT